MSLCIFYENNGMNDCEIACQLCKLHTRLTGALDSHKSRKDYAR